MDELLKVRRGGARVRREGGKEAGGREGEVAG